MKSSTQVWIGIRNVGDPSPPQFFNGTLGDSFIWALRTLGVGFHMKNRVSIQIGRDKESVMAGLDLKRGMSTVKSEELETLLASVIGELDSEDDTLAEGGYTELRAENESQVQMAVSDPNDDWVEPGFN